MDSRRLGRQDVSAIGLGCMGMSWAYGEGNNDRSISVIHQALDAGVNFLDTANVYGDGANEELVGTAIADRRDEVVLATKMGLVVDDLASRQMHRDGSPEQVHKAARASLRRLGTEHIDLYYLHRVDPQVPLEETWGALAQLVEQGLVRYLGLSEVDTEHAATAHAVHPVTAIQSELSLWTRQAMGGAVDPGTTEPPGDVLGWCRDHGAGFVPFAPLGRGYLTGALTESSFGDADFRASNPRFTAEAMAANRRIVDIVKAIAQRKEATPAQVAIAWTLAQGEHVVPIPGTKNPRYLQENMAAVELQLTPDDLQELDSVPQPVGNRY